MRQLAMRAVDLAPGLKQLKDRRDLLGAQAVHRVSAGPLVLKASGIAPASPPPRPTLIQLQIRAGAPMLPPVSEHAVDHAQQLLLGGLIDPAGDPATQSQRPFPSTSINRTPISFNASDRRAISALASASSGSWPPVLTPGRDAASASSAPCLAT